MKIPYRAPYELAYAHHGDAGVDVRTVETLHLGPGETKTAPTGVFLQLPAGTEAQVRPRSSISRDGILVHFGTVDSGYRGEIHIILTNLSRRNHIILENERIAQLVFSKIEDASLTRTEQEFEMTSRGSNGFGSTGRC